MNATTSNLCMHIEGECYFHMPPGALLKAISFALYKHVCITFQPTHVSTGELLLLIMIEPRDLFKVFSPIEMLLSPFQAFHNLDY
jgi:hypothetical protein